ncbi:alpha-L-fucosidase [Pelagicoccus mobilis]|uniref:alpha-L-fucosidase n=1 Tax=Pelagicoccus mobilis TaxID=415221 RepID=A0A934VPP7_9BACT|nr:alpha-L-fucosidase [Pelagicoccus mobilis]MBK1876035.1 alpha-L-fucosidase [Pelagicoccus mobilis]
MKRITVFALLLGALLQSSLVAGESRSKALEEWSAMKFGLFIHWGIYSIPAGVWDGKQIEKLGEQIQRHAKIPHDEYAALAAQFNPVNFDADEIVALAKKAGMRYVVLTAKHHDGFCMFESEHTDFDIMDATPYKKDILKQLADACRKHGLKLGVYYSTPDWRFTGPYPEINPHDGKISVFGKVSKANEDFQVAQLKELMSNYGDIVELFFDMGEPTPEQSKRFADTVRDLQPSCMINGRVMNNQGDFITMPDNHMPDVPLTEIPWESPGTFYHTWGYKSWVKGDPLEKQVPAQIQKLVTIAARGGNFLLNIGPMSDGSVVPYERDVLNGIAEWTAKYGESVFGTGVTPFAKSPWGECTTGEGKLYLHVFDWPEGGKIEVPGLQNPVTAVYALSNPDRNLRYSKGVISLKEVERDPSDTVIVVEYEEPLSVERIRSEPKVNGTLVLKGEEAIHHGKYGRESYRSILADYYRTWDVGSLAAGTYDVSLVYKLKAKEKDFMLEVAGGELSFSLKGKADKVESFIMDGNEEISELADDASGKWQRATIGTINVLESGNATVTLRQGQEFEFKATLDEFKKQDTTYRSMKLDVKALVFSKK